MECAKKKLVDCCTKIGSGATPTGGATVYIDEGVSLIRSQNVYNLEFDYDGLAHITDEAAKKLNGVTIQSEDVLFNITGDSVARTCIVPDDVIPARVNQHVAIIRTKKDELNSRFLNYYLASPQMQYYMLALASGKGASRKAITKDMIGAFEVPCPEIDIQEKIVDILHNYDQLIENNTKRIKLLEQMAENLYKEWFVRFRFPGHETAEFENGLPKGWSSVKLFDIADVMYGYSFSSDDFCEDIMLNPVVRIRDVPNNMTKTFTSEKCDDKYVIKENAILVGMDGIFHMCLWSGGRAYLNQRVVQINSKCDNLCNYFLYYSIYPQVKFWEQTISGTTVAHLGDKHLKKMRVILPDEVTLKNANKVMNDVMIEISSLRKRNQNLIKQRDLLLPRLMSGKLEVK